MSFKQFLGPIRLAIKDGLAYKFDSVIWTVILPINFLVFYFLWHAVFLYGGVQAIRGLSFQDLVLYYALVMLFNVFNYAGVTEALAERIRRGKFVVNLVQPMNIVLRYLSAHIGIKLMALLLEALPLAALIVIFIRPSVAPINLLIFCISVIFASVISFMMMINIGLLAFWMKQVDGLILVTSGVANILRGSIVPLAFFPYAIQSIVNYLPFPYMLYMPVQIFLGKLSLAGSLGVLGIQLFWIVVFYALARLVLHAGLKVFTGAGT